MRYAFYKDGRETKIDKKSPPSKKRVGLFGGTFNPIHLGHLRGAEEIREAFRLEEVIFIPSASPPHKDGGKVIEARHRLEMVRLATSSNPFFTASDVELSRSGKSYSIDTLRFFQKKYPDSLFFILGRDAFEEIETWKEFQELFSFSHFIVMARPGPEKSRPSVPFPKALVPNFQHNPDEGAWIHGSGHKVYFKEISYLDISSTRTRELIGQGRSARYLIPREVEAYVQKHGLYQKNL